jgi:hypothetical protein
MDSHDRQLIVAHIESMNNLTKAITLQSAALLEQNQVISELANAVGALVEAGTEDSPGADPDPEDEPASYMTLMDGTKVPMN